MSPQGTPYRKHGLFMDINQQHFMEWHFLPKSTNDQNEIIGVCCSQSVSRPIMTSPPNQAGPSMPRWQTTANRTTVVLFLIILFLTAPSIRLRPRRSLSSPSPTSCHPLAQLHSYKMPVSFHPYLLPPNGMSCWLDDSPSRAGSFIFFRFVDQG